MNDEIKEQIDQLHEEIDDLESQIGAAEKAADDKIKTAHEYAVQQAISVSQKYLTVNGWLQVKAVYDKYVLIYQRKDIKAIAKHMSTISADMAKIIKEAKVEQFDDLFDELVDFEFVKRKDDQLTDADIVKEYLVCELCQQLHDSLMDIVHFSDSTTREIENLYDELSKRRDSLAELEA